MKQIRRIAFIGFLIISGFNSQTLASHVMGSEITWTCVGQDSFLIKLVVYRDCNGITLSTTPITFSCDSAGTTITTLNIAVGTPIDITPLCNSACSRCTSASCSFAYGVHKYSMQSIVRLNNSANCCNIKIKWEQCCRTSAITTGAGGSNFYVEAKLNRCQSPVNNSPAFSNIKFPILCVGQDYNLDFSATDGDTNINGKFIDSLTYEWTDPLYGPGSPISYTGSYLYYRPIYFWGFPNDALAAPRGLHLNSQTGFIQVRPMKAEITVLAIKVKEFRNGVKISEILRDIQVIVISCAANTAPVITTVGYVKSKTICVGDSVTFNIETNDANANDTVKLSWSNNIPGANWVDNGMVKHPSATFTWTPSANQVSNLPYTFTVVARDNGCPVAAQDLEIYEIYVKPNLSGSYNIIDSGCGKYLFTASASLDTSAKFIWGGSLNETLSSFIHSFRLPGKYPFSIEIKSNFYCFDTLYDTLVTDTFLWIKVANDTTICYSSTINLNVQAFETKGKVRYIWSTGDTVALINISPTVSTWYKVKVSDLSGCSIIDSIYVTVSSVPVKVNNDMTVCKGQSVLLSASYNFNSYNWNTGATSRTITKSINQPVWYKVTARDYYNCLSIDSVFVDIYPVTTVNAGADTSICSINGLYELKGLPDASSGGTGSWNGTAVFKDASIKWYFNIGASDVSNRVLYPLTYYYKDTFGCTYSDDVTLKAYKHTLNAGIYNNVCINGNPINLSGTPSGGYWLGSGVYGFYFNPKLAGIGTHMLTYNLSDYCIFSDSTYIIVYPLPNIQLATLDGKTSFCPNQGFIPLTANPAGGQWSGDVEANHTFNTNRMLGNYSIRYSFQDNNGCSATDTLFLKVAVPVISIESDKMVVCNGSSVHLKANFNIADSIRWSKDVLSNGYFAGSSKDTEVDFIPGQNDFVSGGFWIKVKTISSMCTTDTDSIYIKTGYLPVTDFSASQLSGKVPLQVSFNDLSTIQNGSVIGFNWAFGDGFNSIIRNPVHFYENAGSYNVKLTTVSDIGCKDSLTKYNYIATTSSIQDDKNTAYINLFPNPATSYIDVSLTDKRYQIVRLYIYDASGTLIRDQNNMQQNFVRINSQDFRSGLYLLRIISDKGSEYNTKFVKE